jgi:catechol 2,3-dioxygenase-like lactoylglutathione lyase family enzyme
MALTGVEGVHHIGVPVKDLQASMDWYRELFGIEPEFVRISEGPEGPELDDAVGLKGVSVSVAYLRVGNTLLELLQYHQPQGEPFALRNCDIGALHVCFQVEDIHATHAALAEAGVTFSVEPTRLDYGPLVDHWFCYFRDPDGIQLELFQLPR